MLREVARAFVGEGEITERQGAVLVASAGVVFSFSAIAFRAVEGASDFQFLFWRGFSTLLAMGALVLLRSRTRRPVVFRGISWRTWLAGLVLSTTGMLYILSLARTTAATTLFLLAAAPVVAAVIGWIVLRESVERATIIAICATAIGIATMVGANVGSGSWTGLAFAACIPVAIGSYSVLMRSSLTVDPVVPALLAALFLTIIAAATTLPRDGVGVSARDIALATVAGGFALGIGLPMFNLGHRSVAAARVPLLLMTEVVLAPLWVWIWPGEAPGTATLAGGAIVITAVVWLTTRTSTRVTTAPSPEAPSVTGQLA